MTTRVGLGYDIHRLVKGLPLRLGGVDIDHVSGLDGHSDADVLIHAIIDALLGAAGERCHKSCCRGHAVSRNLGS